jgi:hypothetical protein
MNHYTYDTFTLEERKGIVVDFLSYTLEGRNQDEKQKKIL